MIKKTWCFFSVMILGLVMGCGDSKTSLDQNNTASNLLKKNNVVEEDILIDSVGDSGEFITTWQFPAGTTIQLPLYAKKGRAGFTVNWGDGSSSQDIDYYWDGNHTYETGGVYVIRIKSLDGYEFPRWIFYDDDQSAQYLTGINRFGQPGWKDMAFAFRGCENLNYVSFADAGFDEVDSFVAMFEGAFTNVDGGVSLNFRGMSFPNADDFALMFREANLDHVDFSNVTFPKGTDFRQMFKDTQVNSVDFSNASFTDPSDPHKTVVMNLMFEDSAVQTATFKDADFSQVLNIKGLFMDTKNLLSVDLQVKDHDMSKVENMRVLFDDSNISTIDMSGLILSNLTDVTYAFSDIKNLVSLSFEGAVMPSGIDSVDQFRTFYGSKEDFQYICPSANYGTLFGKNCSN